MPDRGDRAGIWSIAVATAFRYQPRQGMALMSQLQPLPEREQLTDLERARP